MSLIKIYATPDYFQFGLRGNFGSEGEMDETPFYPFPMHFPKFYDQKDKRMLDVLISDHTINSLFRHLHKLLNFLILLKVAFTFKSKQFFPIFFLLILEFVSKKIYQNFKEISVNLIFFSKFFLKVF